MRTPHISHSRGFSIPEVLITSLLVVLVATGFWSMFKNTFSVSRRLQASLSIQQELQIFSRRFSAEIRSAAPSETGSYAIATASTTELTFYTDADNDGTIERIHYFVQSGQFKKGTLRPTGSPLAYTGTESVRTLVRNVVATTTSTFLYYDTNYSGTTTPLTQPVTASTIRLIKLTLVVDDITIQTQPAFVSTTQVSVRTLKDNL